MEEASLERRGKTLHLKTFKRRHERVVRVTFSCYNLCQLTLISYRKRKEREYAIKGNSKLTEEQKVKFGDEVHRKTDTLLSGNNTTAAGLEPQTLRSGGSSSNH